MYNNLRETRKKHGLTQEEMALKLGYKSKSGYAMIESGKNHTTVDTALNISKILGKPVEYLFQRKSS